MYLRLLNYAILPLFALAIYPAEAKQQRSYHAIKQFKLEHPCPANGRYKGRCEGYVIDHVKPLACGGIDTPKNMQWQTVEDAKAKDRWERVGC
jgi:hypothetical protein